MRIGRPFAGIALVAGLLSIGADAYAHPAADDFLNPQPAAPHLTLMPFVGPGFRATYDQRFQVEKDMSEVRTQLIGTVAVPFSEVSANIDARFFLMSFGASIGYHDEWHELRFNPDPQSGRDNAGVPGIASAPNTPTPVIGFTDLTRDARAVKDQNGDINAKSWLFEELRWGFLWPGYNFMGVSNLAFRNEGGRPDVTYDWENGTVLNGGWNIRWEAYGLLRSRNIGFIGPAIRAMVLPRNRTLTDQKTPDGNILPEGSACQFNAVQGVGCTQVHEFEFQYGVLAGMQPNWVNSGDTLLIRAYTTYGLKNDLFGTQAFRAPLQLLFAYMVDIDF